MTKDIKDYSDTELKAIAYDNLVQTEKCNANIAVVNAEFSRRSEQATQSVQEEVKEEKK